MNADGRLLALFVLLASVGTSACDDNGGSLTCGITEAICQNANKTLDAENCVCVRKKSHPSCNLTEEICRSENKMLDAGNCICVSHNPEPSCSLTEEICRSENKMLDAGNCICVDKDMPGPSTCKDDEHAYGNGCEVDTTENCGSHGYNCSAEVYGWKSGTCTDGQCVVTECDDKLYLKKEGICVKNLNLGDYIIFGHYEQDNEPANGKEPIVWRVLEMSAGSYFVISEKVIDVMPYNTSFDESLTWENSTIRSWLNGYDGSDSFIDAAFNESEKNKINVSVVMDEELNQNYSTWKKTEDKIFLLSIEDVGYLGYDPEDEEKYKEDYRADATPYVVKKGARVIGSEHTATIVGTCADTYCYADWWLRSPGKFNYLRGVVGKFGDVIKDGYIAHDEGVGVRPVMWISQ